jgi:hypothetical protein|tara:strand:+ start:121 stop:420 length:300 start_codon:yes stop_codon:yes gene_type:complete
MNLTGTRMRKLRDRLIVLAIILILLWLPGCVSGNKSGAFPIHARPVLPKALVEPDKAFVKCGDDYYCVTLEDLNGLRVYTIEMDSLVRKYEYATGVINE